MNYSKQTSKEDNSTNLNFKSQIKKSKAVIIGAGGKVSKEAVKDLYQKFPDSEELELVLFTSDIEDSTKRVEGFIADLISSMFLTINICNKKIKIITTNNFDDIANSDLIVILAGKWPTSSEKEYYKQIDSSGRLVQSFKNIDMIIEISKNISKFSPKSLVAVVTNQSDMMANVVRNNLNSEQEVIGVGGSLDSSRFKKCFIDSYLEVSREKNLSVEDIFSLSVQMIGYHNSFMIPLYSSIKINEININDFIRDEVLRNDILEKTLSKTRSYGDLVSKMQKDARRPNINTGSSILPGKAISQLILAYCTRQSPIEQSFNIYIDNDKLANHYGMKTGQNISIPIFISERNLKINLEYKVQETEKQHLQKSFVEMEKLTELLYNKCIN